VLIPLYKIHQATERGYEHSSADSANKSYPVICHLSIDVARFGSDKSVFALNKNNHFSLFPFYHLDMAKLTGEAINLIKIHKPSKVSVDCDGLGAGVFDNLNEAKNSGIIDTELYEIHGGGNPLQLGQTEDYLNLRAQMYWLFKNDIDLISLEQNDELEEGLSSIKHYFNSKGKIQIESKDEIKKRLGRSPDMEDALVYCNFLKYVYSNTCGEFEYGDPAEKRESVTEKIGI
jgi:phage terminase large subunit